MMALSQAAIAVNGRLLGSDVAFQAVTTDSRKVVAGDLFIALKGERFDGHEFVAQCAAQGAAAVMVDREMHADVPQIVVGDTRIALGLLASDWRSRFAIPLAAVTGSNGKTTVKEMLAAILRNTAGKSEAVLATEGNLNNDIGMPLTLLKLRDQHQYAVIEMGMNHPGEIDYLTRLAQPTVALINNAQPAHLEGLGSVEAVAKAKGEIFAGLTSDGVAIINADDPFSALWRTLAAPLRVMTFGLEQAADVSTSYELNADHSEITLNTPQGSIGLILNVPGLHNVRNALAATAAALAMGVSLPNVAAGLAGFSGVKGRLQRKTGKNGCTVIDDTYNANPASMLAAVRVLATAPGKRIFVMGDMGELGPDAPRLHAEIGAAAREAGLEQLFALGENSMQAVNRFGSAARHFVSVEDLWTALQGELAGDVTVLVKGSRFMRMERVVEMLTTATQKLTQEGSACC